MKRFLIWSLSIVAVLLLIWADGLATAIRRGDIASLEDYFRIQAYSLRSRDGVSVSQAELSVEPQRAQFLIDAVRAYAAERDMVVAVGPRSDGDPLVHISVWGGKAFNVSLANILTENTFRAAFFEFDKGEDWRPYRDDFVVFLRSTFGAESVREIR